MKTNKLQMLFFSFLIGTSVTYADHVAVDGPTYVLPNTKLLQTVNVKLNQNQVQELTSEVSSFRSEKVGFQPLDTSLKPCVNFKSKPVNIEHLARPLFVIGDDQSSFDWLAKYKNTLEKIGAIGLVVKAKDINRLKQIRAAAGQLELYPAKGDALNKMFGVSCYPALISKHLIEH